MSATEAAVLWRLSRYGPSRITELAQLEHVSQPAMTQLINRLEKSGHVVRLADSSDARAVPVGVTDAGTAAVDARLAERVSLIRALIASVPEPDRESLRRATPAIERLAE